MENAQFQGKQCVLNRNQADKNTAPKQFSAKTAWHQISVAKTAAPKISFRFETLIKSIAIQLRSCYWKRMQNKNILKHC